MHALLTYIVLLLSLLMFVVKREHKICLLLIDILCFNGVGLPVLGNILSPFFCFFITEMFHIKQYYALFKNTNLNIPLIILFLGMIILVIHSPHIVGTNGLFYFFLSEFVCKYGIFFIVFIACLGCKSQKPIIYTTFACLMVLTTFGILNLITKHAVYIDWVLAGVDADSVFADAGAKFTYSDRFRVQAMYANPFDYGYACLMLFLYYWYLLKEKLIKKNIFYIAAVCSIFGIFACGCRTLLACLIISILIFAIFGYNLKSKFKLALSGVFVLFAVALIMPENFNKQVDFLTSAFTDDKTVDGSSLSMRQTQLAAVMFYIQNDMAFGRGYDFFIEDLGWGGGRKTAVDSDLQGLEGIYLNFLLERGIVGLVLYTLFWIAIIWICYRIAKRTKDKTTLAFNYSVIACYLAFANMTGELASAPITLLFVGLGTAWCSRGVSTKKGKSHVTV